MRLWCIGILCAFSLPAWAILPYGATPAEKAMCDVRVYARIGADPKNDGHMHHYCGGLRFIDRAIRSFNNPSERKYYLGVAIDEFNYILGHTSKDYHMRAEVHLEKARALKMAGRKSEAFSELMHASQYNVHWARLYRELADHYQEIGDKEKALETVSEGLRYNPKSKSLQRRYKELGGNEPFPEPYQQSEK